MSESEGYVRSAAERECLGDQAQQVMSTVVQSTQVPLSNDPKTDVSNAGGQVSGASKLSFLSRYHLQLELARSQGSVEGSNRLTETTIPPAADYLVNAMRNKGPVSDSGYGTASSIQPTSQTGSCDSQNTDDTAHGCDSPDWHRSSYEPSQSSALLPDSYTHHSHERIIQRIEERRQRELARSSKLTTHVLRSPHSAQVKIDQFSNAAPIEAGIAKEVTLLEAIPGHEKTTDTTGQAFQTSSQDHLTPSFNSSGGMSTRSSGSSAMSPDVPSSHQSSQQTDRSSSTRSTPNSQLSEIDVAEAVVILQGLCDIMRRERCCSACRTRNIMTNGQLDNSASISQSVPATAAPGEDPVDMAAASTHRGEGSSTSSGQHAKSSKKSGKRKRADESTRKGDDNDEGDEDDDDLDARKHRCLSLIAGLIPDDKVQMPCPINIQHSLHDTEHLEPDIEQGCHGTDSTWSVLLRKLLGHGICICQNCCTRIALHHEETAENAKSRHKREGCQARCIQESCPQTHGLDLLDMAHNATSRCSPSWASKSTSRSHIWRYIYALVHDTNDAPFPKFETGPEYQHSPTACPRFRRTTSAGLSGVAQSLQEEVLTFVQHAAALRREVGTLRQQMHLKLAEHIQELEVVANNNQAARMASCDKYEGKITNLQLIIMELCDTPFVQAQLSRSLRIRIQAEAPSALPTKSRIWPHSLPSPPPVPHEVSSNGGHLGIGEASRFPQSDLPASGMLEQQVLSNSFVGMLPSGDLDFGQLVNTDPEDWTTMLAG